MPDVLLGNQLGLQDDLLVVVLLHDPCTHQLLSVRSYVVGVSIIIASS